MAVEKKDIEQDLADSLKELVLHVPFEKITIKQITDGAGVIRVTFYHHFQDKYDLLGWIIRREILEPVRILIENNMFKEANTLIFSNLLRNKEFYMRAVKIEGQNSFEEISETCIYELLCGVFNDRAAGRSHPWLTVEAMANYHARSMNYIVMNWIRTGMNVPPEEMADIYEYVATHSMWEMMDDI